MKYLISETPLRLKEFGRNVQSMIEYAITIQDRKQRTRFAEQIVQIMLQLQPSIKDGSDIKQYLWDSLFVISDFRLDVDSPYPVPEPNAFLKGKKKVPYTNQPPVYNLFGKNVELALQQTAKLEGDKRWDMIVQIASFMRQCLEEQNREAFVEEAISDYMYELSNGNIRVHPQDLAELLPAVPPARLPLNNPKSKNTKSGNTNVNNANVNNSGKNRNAGNKFSKRRR